MSIYDPTVDILIRCKNSAKFLPRALQSVQNQSFARWHLILLVEPSEDKTLKHAEAFVKESPRKVSIVQIPSKGMGAAYNSVEDVLTAPYVCQFDSDDLLHPDALKLCIAATDGLQTRGSSGVVTTYQQTDSRGGLQGKLMKPDPEKMETVLMTKYALMGLPFFARDAVERVGGWNPAFKFAATFDLYHRLLEAHGKFALATTGTKEPVLYWRRHPKQVSEEHKTALHNHIAKAIADATARREKAAPRTLLSARP